jgi:hypothetical protein
LPKARARSRPRKRSDGRRACSDARSCRVSYRSRATVARGEQWWPRATKSQRFGFSNDERPEPWRRARPGALHPALVVRGSVPLRCTAHLTMRASVCACLSPELRGVAVPTSRVEGIAAPTSLILRRREAPSRRTHLSIATPGFHRLAISKSLGRRAVGKRAHLVVYLRSPRPPVRCACPAQSPPHSRGQPPQRPGLGGSSPSSATVSATSPDTVALHAHPVHDPCSR